MPSAAIVDDRSYFAFDVYEDRSGTFVKIMSGGPFLMTEDQARQQYTKIVQDNAPHVAARPRKVIASRYNQGLMRWTKWL